MQITREEFLSEPEGRVKQRKYFDRDDLLNELFYNLIQDLGVGWVGERMWMMMKERKEKG